MAFEVKLTIPFLFTYNALLDAYQNLIYNMTEKTTHTPKKLNKKKHPKNPSD